jgi:pyrroline-5-carboxylate reductase
MARALAAGWGEPFLCTDGGSGRARALADDLGGRALGSNAELVERADLVVLAHKPASLVPVAAELAGAGVRARALVSVLAGTTRAQVRAAHPGTPVLRIEPSTLVEVRRGAMVMAAPEPHLDPPLDPPLDPALVAAVRERFARLGEVVEVPEALFGAASALCGVGPAYWALLVEAQVDAGVRRGLSPAQASLLVTATMGGAAELIAAHGYDTLAVRRAVASPGGVTARGLAALEAGGVRAALSAAMDAVAGE